MTLEPIHDDNSHGADALRSFAMGIGMGFAEPPAADYQYERAVRRHWLS